VANRSSPAECSHGSTLEIVVERKSLALLRFLPSLTQTVPPVGIAHLITGGENAW